VIFLNAVLNYRQVKIQIVTSNGVGWRHIVSRHVDTSEIILSIVIYFHKYIFILV